MRSAIEMDKYNAIQSRFLPIVIQFSKEHHFNFYCGKTRLGDGLKMASLLSFAFKLSQHVLNSKRVYVYNVTCYKLINLSC